MFVALTMIPASIYQMMRGLIVFVAAMLSIIFLKRRYYIHHWTSLVFVVGGVAIVGASPLLFPEDDGNDDGSNVTLGIILVIIAQLFAGGLMISEEILLGNYYLDPLKVVGWEGFWGCSIYLIILTVFQFIKCSNADICPHGRLEDTPGAVKEMFNNPVILLLAIGTVFSIAFFNGFGVAVTKYASAAQRSTIDTSRTLLIWGIFLFKPGKGKERFIALELVGFVLLVIGTIVFNEIVVIPLFGFDKNTKAAFEAKRKAIEGDNENNSKQKSEFLPTGFDSCLHISLFILKYFISTA